MKKEQRRLARGYDVEEEFLAFEPASNIASAKQDAMYIRPLGPARNSGEVKYAGIDAAPLVGAFSGQHATHAPAPEVLQHMYAADPNENRLFGGRMNEGLHDYYFNPFNLLLYTISTHQIMMNS